MRNLISIIEAIGKNCPLPTQDFELNTKNRDASIKAKHIQYGPLNVGVPGDYWIDIATTGIPAKRLLKQATVQFVQRLIYHQGC